MRNHRRMSKLLVRIPLLVAAITLALASLLTSAGMATAATSGPLTARDTAVAGSVILKQRSNAKVILCEMVFIGLNGGLGAPHQSFHVPGSINVRVRVTCNSRVASIKATVALFSNTGSKINPYRSAGVATARGNAALVCKPGHYQGVSEATVTAPPGFVPHVGKLLDSTVVVQIKKC